MEKLKEHKLYGEGLIEVKNKQTVARYNSALEAIGLDRTELEKFNIDGWGWSPEIAAEKEDEFYLSHGLANPYAIIITPDQEQVPVYMPHHSFDNRMMSSVFEKYRRQIYDMTIQTAIIMECDQEVSSYRASQDLLAIEYFTIKFSTPDNLSEAKEVQMALERKFYDKQNAWADKELRDLLRASYRKHGVLADKKFLLPDHTFTDIDSFYTRAFGGTFVIRNERKLKQTLLIREVENKKNKGIHGQASFHLEYHLPDPELFNLLLEKDVIGVYPQSFFEQVEDLERILFLLLAEILFEKEPELDVYRLTDGQIKRSVNQYGESGDLGDDYFELEKIINTIKKGKLIQKSSISPSLSKILTRPNMSLDKNKQWLFWRALLKLNPSDLFRLYVYDKAEFFIQYHTWPAMKKDWALNYIKGRYINFKNLPN